MLTAYLIIAVFSVAIGLHFGVKPLPACLMAAVWPLTWIGAAYLMWVLRR